MIAAGLSGVVGWWGAKFFQGNQDAPVEGVEPPQELVKTSQAIQETVPLTQQAIDAVGKNIAPSQEQIDKILAAIDKATPALAKQSPENTTIKGFTRDSERCLIDVRTSLLNWAHDEHSGCALRDSIKKFEKDILINYNRILRLYIDLENEKSKQIEPAAFQKVVEQAKVCESATEYISGFVFKQEPISPEELALAIKPFAELISTIYSVVRT